MQTDNAVRSTIKRDAYSKLRTLAKYEGRTLSKMLEILVENYPDSAKILRRSRK